MKMAMAAKVEKISKETIRPSSPTPLNLKTLKLSLMDQFTPVTYMPLVLFYPSSNADDQYHQKTQVNLIKTSLSQTLSSNYFYPFAGRLNDNVFIDCNDEGDEFIEAKTNCSLSDILNNPDIQLLQQFLPATSESPEAASGNLLLVQVTFFNCNGLAIGVCVSHKMADAATLTTFINCWASMAANNKVASSPVFMGASLFPPLLSQDMSIPNNPVELRMSLNCMTKRFEFTGSKIEKLKAKVASTTVPQPTRVEAVSALIWKAVMAAVRENKLGFRNSVWSISVNLRKRLLPKIPENYAGNCVGFIGPKIDHQDDESTQIDLPELVRKLRKEMENFEENYAKKLQGEGALLAICGVSKEFGDMAMHNDIDFYVCSSWCKYDLYGGADFGWGKPIWLSTANTTTVNVAVLMDTRDGHGIEVWLTLSKEDMALLESNQELLEFADVNPSVPF